MHEFSYFLFCALLGFNTSTCCTCISCVVERRPGLESVVIHVFVQNDYRAIAIETCIEEAEKLQNDPFLFLSRLCGWRISIRRCRG